MAGYLVWRNLGKPEDYRYQAMRERHGKQFPFVSLFTVFGLQGLLMWIISLPTQVGISKAASVTYDLSRLQEHDSPVPILLTLNETSSIDPAKFLRTFSYHHPAYSRESISAQLTFQEISGQRHTHFCGAYWGYGFHEDGVNSALEVTRHFGIDLEACTVASMKEPLRTAAAIR